MAQYVSKTFTTEAYKIGNDNVPEWFSEAIANDEIMPVFAPNSFCISGWAVKRVEGNQFANIGDYIIKTSEGLHVNAATSFETMYLFDDARLLTVLTKNDDTTTGDGATAADPIVWAIAVANTVTGLALTDITAGTDATFKLYSDATFATEVTGVSTIALTAGAATNAYIKVTSAAATEVIYYKVAITRAAA